MTDALEVSVDLESKTADDTWTTGDLLVLAAIAVICLLVCWAVVRAMRRGANLDYTDLRRHDHSYYPMGDSRGDERRAWTHRDKQDSDDTDDKEGETADAGGWDDGGSSAD